MRTKVTRSSAGWVPRGWSNDGHPRSTRIRVRGDRRRGSRRGSHQTVRAGAPRLHGAHLYWGRSPVMGDRQTDTVTVMNKERPSRRPRSGRHADAVRRSVDRRHEGGGAGVAPRVLLDVHVHRRGLKPEHTMPVTITSPTDNVYDDLATRAGSTCKTLIGTTFRPGDQLDLNVHGSTQRQARRQADRHRHRDRHGQRITVMATAQATVTSGGRSPSAPRPSSRASPAERRVVAA